MRYTVLFAAFLLLTGFSAAQESEESRFAADEAAIRKQVDAYVAAFNAGDAEKVAAIWSTDAVYTNRTTGEEASGREAIAKQFAAQFDANKGTKLEVSVASIRFLSPNVAMEKGTAELIYAEGEPLAIGYSAIYVKSDGTWLLDRVTDEDLPVVLSNYDKLKELEWMVGTWVDQYDSGSIETTCTWSTNKNFLVRKFAVSAAGRVEMSGMQVIGWDAANQNIRSWVFDSDGGFTGGTWTTKGDRWMIRASGYSADGTRHAAVNIITKIDDDTHTYQSISRTAGGEILPNIDEIVVVRKK